MEDMKQTLTKISKEKNIDFPNLLFYVMKCEMIKALVESGHRVFFKSEPKLREGLYQSSRDSSLSILAEDLGIPEIMMILSKAFEKTEIVVDAIKASGRKIEVVLSYERAKERFEIERTKVSEGEIYPDRKSYEDILTGKIIEIDTYQAEARACELIVPILEKLELMNDMEIYEELFGILCLDPLDGLKLSRCLEDSLSKSNISEKEKLRSRYERYATYKNNSFLKKRWKAYLRVNREKDIKWEDVHTKILNCFGKVIEANLNNDIFIDSWMPELGRFLS